MKCSIFILAVFLLSLFSAPAQSSRADSPSQHIILCGGPSLLSWEKLRRKTERHDRWWANFIRASTIRFGIIRRAYGENSKVTWIVYRKGYQIRQQEDGVPYVKYINDLAVKYKVRLVWINTGDQAINAINKHPSRSVRTFDFFGHSNKHCFMLDYGSEVLGASKAWIHEKNLWKLKGSIYAPGAVCQSYGCHTGESMSAFWKKALGHSLVGARGKTDYAMVGRGKMPHVNGRWIY